jgi:S-(hydroxymethyl)mycothiol dehydrogenase
MIEAHCSQPDRDGQGPFGVPALGGALDHPPFASVVEAVGAGVENLRVGDRVIVAWSVPCGRCRNCVARRAPQLCSTMYTTGALDPRFRLDGQPVLAMNGVGTFA